MRFASAALLLIGLQRGYTPLEKVYYCKLLFTILHAGTVSSYRDGYSISNWPPTNNHILHICFENELFEEIQIVYSHLSLVSHDSISFEHFVFGRRGLLFMRNSNFSFASTASMSCCATRRSRIQSVP